MTTLRKGALLTLGVLSLTRERAQKIADDLERRGLLDRKHARGFVNDLIVRGKEERAAFPRLIRNEIDASLGHAGMANARQVAALEKRIAALERRAKKTKRAA